jgi:hypothetical protein
MGQTITAPNNQVISSRTVSASTTLLSSDNFIRLQVPNGGMALNFPPSPKPSQRIVVLDDFGTVSMNNPVQMNGTVNGNAAGFTFNIQYQSATFVSNNAGGWTQT